MAPVHTMSNEDHVPYAPALNDSDVLPSLYTPYQTATPVGPSPYVHGFLHGTPTPAYPAYFSMATPSSQTFHPMFTTTPQFAPIASVARPPHTPSKRPRRDSVSENLVRSPLSPRRNHAQFAHIPGPPLQKKQRRSPLTVHQKLARVFAVMRQMGWSLGVFLFYVFRTFDQHGKPVQRTKSHASYVSKFLQGHHKHTPAQIINFWYRSADGQPSKCREEVVHMFSTTISYLELKAVRPALSSFAAQVVMSNLRREAHTAVKTESGLHASYSNKEKKQLVWADIGSATIPQIEDIVRTLQPLLWDLLMAVAEKSKRNKLGIIQQPRPPNVVVLQAITSLDFCRNNRANLFPLSRGLLYFALSAPYDLFLYNSRLGSMPAYSTIYKALEVLALDAARHILQEGMDPEKARRFWIDNVQNYLRQRDARIGRINKLNIGIAATFMQDEDCNIAAFDVDDKIKRITESKRSELTIEQLVSFIDQRHRDTVGALQWLRTLVHYIPQLKHHQAHVSLLYHTRAAKQPLPVKATKVHPLATSGKNEAVTTDLDDALHDFMGQVGQSREKHQHTLTLVGGDGLTYDKILDLKNYKQFHENEFDRWDVIEPVLAPWHTVWTDLSRVVETHWGIPLSRDPSTLGHSVGKIKRATPPNLKKVDYNSAADFVYTILDARMLDCYRVYYGAQDIFTYFTELEARDSLPEFEDLEVVARKLYRAYSSFRAVQHAMLPIEDDSPPTTFSETIPMGSPWQDLPMPDAIPTATKNTSKKRKQGASEKAEDATLPFKGDRALAQSIAFMRDAVISREFTYAIAEGDPGRIYETMKIMLFSFGGSAHSKYTSFLLEMITSLELESSPELRLEILKSILVNLSGRAGHFTAADLMQEYFNRMIQIVAERKGTEYNAHFLRNVVSRNLHHLCRLQTDLKEGIGLKQRSGRHTDPHTNPEIRILLNEYKMHELHTRRRGRRYDNSDRQFDDYRAGLKKLREGKLQKWIHDTTFMRSGHVPADPVPSSSTQMEENGSADGENEEEEEEVEVANGRQMPMIIMEDGILTIEDGTAILEAAVEEALAEYDGGDEEEPDEDVEMSGVESDDSDEEPEDAAAEIISDIEDDEQDEES